MSQEHFYNILDEAYRLVTNEYKDMKTFYSVNQNLHVDFLWNFTFGKAGSKKSVEISYLVGNDWVGPVEVNRPVMGLNGIPRDLPKELGPEEAIKIAKQHGIDRDNDYIQLTWPIGIHSPQWLMNFPQGGCINAMVSVPSGNFSTCKC